MRATIPLLRCAGHAYESPDALRPVNCSSGEARVGLLERDNAMLKRRTVTSDVTDFVRQKIIDGSYRGGEQIRQEPLAAELGVSRIPVREALLQLEAEGLVNIHTHRGAMVATLSAQDAREIFEARSLFEPFLLSKAMAHRTAADVKAVQEELTRYEKALGKNALPEELSRLNWSLHLRMCEPAKRPRLMAILSTLHKSADRYLRIQISPKTARQRALIDHKELFNAYADGDEKTACKLLERHINSALKDVMNNLKRFTLAD
jgi:DNA-binding GntR family transcriptional regulator